MKHSKLIPWFCLLFLVTSCLSTGYDTIILPETKSSNSLSTTINEEYISLSTQEALEEYMPIYEGSDPPVIEGTYLISTMEAVYASDGGFYEGELSYDMKIRFTNQNTEENMLSYYEECVDYEDDYASSDEVNIIGSGDDFTTYFIASGSYLDVNYEEALLISGTLTSSGIEDIYYAFVMLEKGSDPDYYLMDEGEYRIFKDGDNLAEETDWNKSVLLKPIGINSLILSK